MNILLDKQKMKKYIVLYLMFHFSNFISAQKIFTFDYKAQADFKVFIVNYESEADLNVFKVDYKGQASGNDGLWYFVSYESQSNKKIYFVDYKS
jgi:hypothetical protein